MDDKGENYPDPKRPLKKNQPGNYRPITYLPMMWKVLIAQIKEEICYSLVSRGVFPKEQIRC